MWRKTFYNLILLLLICSVSGGLLGFVYEQTKDRIEMEKDKARNISKIEILPEAIRFMDKGDTTFGYDKDKKLVGKIIKVYGDGYCGKIEMLVGLNLEEKITGIKILSHNETPGLGDRITEKAFLEQFLQKSIAEIDLKSEGGMIDAITGATISSRAVIKGIKSIKGLNE